MPRKRHIESREVLADPIYNSTLVEKFICSMMWDGKKATAQRIFYDALDQIKKRMPDVNPIDVFTQAVENVKPPIEVRSKRVGGAPYRADGDGGRISAFDLRHGLPRHHGPTSQIDLTPATSDSQRAKRRSDLSIIHAAMVSIAS